jgi:hypothetical protein
MVVNMSQPKSIDFTLARFAELIEIAKNRYEFSLFMDEYTKSNIILWRHDVDLSIHAAQRLARIEHEQGVRATYFIHLHSEFYNCHEKSVGRLINKLTEYGHDIGLHFDTHYYDITTEIALESHLKYEKAMLERIIDREIRVFSFHNTNEFTLKCEKSHYAGLINTYSSFYKNNISYCSDSNGYWRFDNLYDVLNSSKTILQVLTHPAWWTNEPMSPRDKVVKCAYGRAKVQVCRYDEALEAFGRVNLTEIVT